jgi:FtsZ-interacting cell division protein YlmF
MTKQWISASRVAAARLKRHALESRGKSVTSRLRWESELRGGQYYTAQQIKRVKLENALRLKPNSYQDVRRVGAKFRAGETVRIDLRSTPDADAKRIIDFCAGLVYMGHGHIDRIDSKDFLLIPADIEIDQNEVEETQADERNLEAVNVIYHDFGMSA